MPHWHSASDPAECVELATARFGAAYGGVPDGVWSAPGRVNLIGEHIDYAGGVCLPFALSHRTWVAVRLRTDGVLRLVSGQLDVPWYGRVEQIGPGRTEGWVAYPAGVVWAMLRDGLLPAEFAGADVSVHSSVPMGAG